MQGKEERSDERLPTTYSVTIGRRAKLPFETSSPVKIVLQLTV